MDEYKTLWTITGSLKRLIAISDLSLMDITVASRDEITAWQTHYKKETH
ncbi:MAG: hypothetical protein J5680_01860 [Neisseriaceae bacterium]|nr:hypothetical protein [Neisseriaceae bacterium]